MADDKIRINAEGDITIKGGSKSVNEIEKVTKAVNKLDKAMGKVINDKAEFAKASSFAVKPEGMATNTYNSIIRNGIHAMQQTTISGMGITMKGAFGDKAFQEQYKVFVDHITASLKEQLEIQRESIRVADEKVRKDRQVQASRERIHDRDNAANVIISNNRNQMSDRSYRYHMATLESDLAYKDEKTKWMAYRNKHPNEFTPLRQQAGYMFGSRISSLGQTLSSYGVGGKVAGGLLEVVGSSIINPMLGFATAIQKAIEGIVAFGKAAVDASAEIESLKTNLGIVFGDQAQAQSMFNEISQYAVKSPFGVEQTTEMAVLLRQSGVYATDLMDTLRMIGDTAGGNADKMKRIANNYAQIVSIGKASMLDMRQFAYAGIPIYKAVSEELGVSQEQLRKMISEGKVTSDIIEKVFKDLTGINGLFENATEKGSKTLKARLQNLKDSKQLFMASHGDAILQKGIQERYNGTGFITSIVDALENFFSNGEISQNIRNINKNVESIEKYNTRISFLKEGLDSAKESGDKEKIKLFEEALAHEASRRSISEEKATYLASFNAKQSLLDSIPDEYKGLSAEEIKHKIGEKTYQMVGGNLYIYKDLAEAYGIKGSNSMASDKLVKLGFWKRLANRDALDNLRPYAIEVSEELNKILETLNIVKEFTKEEIQSHREDLVRDRQEQSYTIVDKSASKRGSLLNEISSLTIALGETKEAQEKEKEEQKRKWDEAIDALNSINYAVSDSGLVDYTKLTASQLLDISKRGGFRTDSKYITSYGDDFLKLSDKDKNELKKTLKSNFNSLYEKMASVSGIASSSAYSGLQLILKEWGGGTDKEWFEDFSKVVEEFENTIDKSSLDEIKKEDWHLLVGLATTMLSTANVNGLSTDALDEEEEKKEIGYALWRRITASSLGMPIEALGDTKSNIKAYREFYGAKGAATSVFNSIDSIRTQQKLLRYGGQGWKDGDKVFQVDWVETNKAIKEFALQLGQSTEVIKAYKSGLEQERDTLHKLLSESIYTQETENVMTLQGGIKGTLLTELGDLNSVAAVNAFGEHLYDLQGNKLEGVEATETGFKDKNKKEYKREDIIVSGNIYEQVIRALTDLDHTLGEVNVNLARSTAREKTVENGYVDWLKFSGEGLTGLGFSGKSLEKILKFLDSNPEYDKTLLRGIFDSSKQVVDADNNITQEARVFRNGYVIGDETTFEDFRRTAMTNQNSAAYGAFREMLEEVFRTALSDASLMDVANANKYSSPEYDALDNLLKNNSHYTSSDSVSMNVMKSTLGGTSWLGDVYKQAGIDPNLAKLKEFREGSFKDNEYKQVAWAETFAKNLESARSSLMDIVRMTAERSFLDPFEQIGRWIGTAGEETVNFADGLNEIGKNALKQLGPLMAQAGLQIAASAAATYNWPMLAAGLGLAALGGVVTGISNVEEPKNDKNADDKLDKAQDIKDQLAELLEQARKDALYYEMNLRHKKALGLNKEFSIKSVNDAIISPEGNIVTTHPEDYLIATKTPKELLSGGSRQPNITFKVINNSPDVVVRQERRQNALGETELVAIVEGVVTEYIAGPKGDEAFGVRQARGAGNVAVM